MKELTAAALDATHRIRTSRGYGKLNPHERLTLDRHLQTVERALGSSAALADPYAVSLGTPADLQRELSGTEPKGAQADRRAGPPPSPSASPAPLPPTAVIGQRAAEALQAVNFPGFVAGLISGVFQAIVDSTAQQLREYANLVASLSQSVDSFTRDNVSLSQTRDWFAQQFPADLRIELPQTGKAGEPRLVPKVERIGQSPNWLEQFGLGGQELSEELTEGELLNAGRTHVGEERLQSLAAMVLMGINRIVINDGDIRAKLQFHAVAQDRTSAEMNSGSAAQSSGIAARQVESQGTTTMMVSTLKANAQAETSIKTNLMGEVRVSFRTETFPLERFADSAAIQLLNRHAKWRTADASPTTSTVPTPMASKTEETT